MDMFRYFDAHCDTVTALLYLNGDLAENEYHISLNKAKDIDLYAQFYAIFVNMGEGNTPSQVLTDKYRAMRDTFYKAVEKHGDRIVFCRNSKDLERAEKEGKAAGFMSIEGAEQLFEMTLDDAYADGVRMVCLTWNHKNQFGGSNVTGGGITEEGRALVKRARELGIVVDLSHGSDELFYDVAELMDGKPFICSHSNSRTVWEHTRNITDDMFRELIKCGGVTGMNMYNSFLGAEPVTIDTVVKHIEHFCSLGGENNIAMGGDLDGCEKLPQGIEHVGHIYKIADRLAQLGYSSELIDKIFFGNLLRVVREVIG